MNMDGPKRISPVELKEILRLHKMWLVGMDGGVRAVLRDANLSRLDLSGANLVEADLSGARLSGANLSGANLSAADLSGADLRVADLSGALLSAADLSGALLGGAVLAGTDLDYSCWPLWCGGLHVKTDRRIMAQLAYHFCSQDCSDPDYVRARNAILDFANSFHRTEECGLLVPLPEPPEED